MHYNINFGVQRSLVVIGIGVGIAESRSFGRLTQGASAFYIEPIVGWMDGWMG